MEPETWVINDDHLYTRVGRYSVHTDMVALWSRAYVGPPDELNPIPGARFGISSCDSHDEMFAGHSRIVEFVKQLPQNAKHDIALWITRDEQKAGFELDGYKAGLTGKRVAVAGDDIPFEGREAWVAGYRRGRAEQRERLWREIRNGLSDAPYQCLLSWAKGEDERRLNPLIARFEDFATPLEWSVIQHVSLGEPGSRQIADYYPEYQKGALWRIVIRPRVLARDNYTCWCCSFGANSVHHASYHPLVMSGLADEWLFSVCSKCHEGIHSGDPSYPLQWRRLNARLNKRGFVRQRWKQRIDFGQNLPTPEQIARWQAPTARSESETFRQGMRLVNNRLEIGEDGTLERARQDVGFRL
jgi:ribosome modulation factor